MKVQLLIIVFLAILCQTNGTVLASVPSKSLAVEQISFSDKLLSGDITPTDTAALFTLYIAQNTLNIKCTNPTGITNGEVAIYNILGKEIARKKLDKTNLNQVSVPTQNTCYIVRITYSGKVFTQKVIAAKE